ncbi:hypothetical protein HOI83_02490 [Candidatus Uhrbacteria bacterium]|jgi:hypothetical protein|nr:hypothetical protein [Candidatus Uhrbacteria bacterium]
MSIFDGEYKEKNELYRESREFSEKTDLELQAMIDSGKETFPDVIGCPNRSCGNPLKIKVTDTEVEAYCANCSFSKIYQRKD